MEQQRLIYLLEQFREEQVSSSELEELNTYLRHNKDEALFLEVMSTLMERYPATAGELAAIDQHNELADKAISLDRHLGVPVRPVPVKRFATAWRRDVLRYAAALMLMVGTGIYLWSVHKKSNKDAIATVANNSNIAPGKNGAMLTLANGKKLLLDTIQNSTIALQGGATAKVVNGVLKYEASGNEVVYNTMTTPKGFQYHITLPDGTEAWLNSASSIRYPTVFAGKERKVDIYGEVYFEVKKEITPFKVNVDNSMEIEVLGTTFNVNSYANEHSIRATLLDGSIRVVKGTTATVIHPGEQADVGANMIKIKNNIDLSQVVAWKDGVFNFNNISLEEAMRQLERWYDIEVVYEKGIPDITFQGKLTRDVSLNDLLVGLEKMDVHFKLEDRKLIILP